MEKKKPPLWNWKERLRPKREVTVSVTFDLNEMDMDTKEARMKRLIVLHLHRASSRMEEWDEIASEVIDRLPPFCAGCGKLMMKTEIGTEYPEARFCTDAECVVLKTKKED